MGKLKKLAVALDKDAAAKSGADAARMRALSDILKRPEA
jgi:hypothetical protein